MRTINKGMDTKDQAQIQTMAKTVAQLQQMLAQLQNRVALLERENSKLKHAMRQATHDIGALDRRSARGQ